MEKHLYSVEYDFKDGENVQRHKAMVVSRSPDLIEEKMKSVYKDKDILTVRSIVEHNDPLWILD